MSNNQDSDIDGVCSKNLLNKHHQKKLMVAGCCAWYVFLLWLFVVVPVQYTISEDSTHSFADNFSSFLD